MKKLLITGASGFIGSALAEEAVKKNYDVFAAVRSSSSRVFLEALEVKILELDFSGAEKMIKCFTRTSEEYGAFDYVIHCAGTTKASNELEYYTVNYRYTKNLLQALSESNTAPKKFIYMSSLAALGPGDGNIPIAETNYPKPNTAYGRSKLMSEQLLTSQNKLPYLIIRPTAVYGPRDRELFALVKMINRKIEPYIGVKSQMLSFVFIRDLVKAIFSSMESNQVKRSYIVSDGINYTLRNFNEIVKRNLKRKTFRITIPSSVVRPAALLSESIALLTGIPSAFNRERLKEFEAANWLCNIQSIKNDLNFKADYSLENGLHETIDWYKKNKWL